MPDGEPDSAGFAVYGTVEAGTCKITLQSPDPDKDFAGLDDLLTKELVTELTLSRKSTHAVLSVPLGQSRGGARRRTLAPPGDPRHERRRGDRDL